jgi:hypothetical protein
MEACGLDQSALEYGQVMGSCERGKESSLFIYPTNAQLDCSKVMSKFTLNLH